MPDIDTDNIDTVKQIIVVNLAVPMGYSQLAVQISHASMLGVLNQGEWLDDTFQLVTDGDPDLRTWLKDHFTLVLCKTWGKDSIMKLKAEAESLYLNTAVMEDYGMVTALAIGPAPASKLSAFKRLTLM